MKRVHKSKYLHDYSLKISSLLELQEDNFKKIKDKIKNFNRIIICGNGGSSSIASHVAVDFNKILKKEAITFTDDNLITCFANDYGYENWTLEAMKIYAKKKDLIILISSSGKSKNIVNAAKFIKKNKIYLITMTGFEKNNILSKLGNINIWIDSKSYNFVEMCHHIFLVAIVDSLKNNDN